MNRHTIMPRPHDYHLLLSESYYHFIISDKESLLQGHNARNTIIRIIRLVTTIISLISVSIPQYFRCFIRPSLVWYTHMQKLWVSDISPFWLISSMLMTFTLFSPRHVNYICIIYLSFSIHATTVILPEYYYITFLSGITHVVHIPLERRQSSLFPYVTFYFSRHSLLRQAFRIIIPHNYA